MSLDVLIGLVIAHGYLIIFFAILLDCAGLPIPGELLLLTFGAMVTRGHFDPLLGVAIAAVAAVLGDCLSYWLGRMHGERVTRLRFARWWRVNGLTIVFGRFIVGARVMLAPLAGARRHAFPRFLAFDALGAATWAATFVLLGYVAGARFDAVVAALSGALRVMQVVVGAALAGYLIRYLPRIARVPVAVAAMLLLVMALKPAAAPADTQDDADEMPAIVTESDAAFAP